MTGNDGPLETVVRWSPQLWLAAGALGLVYSSLYGMEALLGTYPAFREFLGPIMNLLAFTALLGLYPILANEQPWAARIGGITAGFAIVGSVVAFAEAAGFVAESASWFLASQLLFIVLGMTVAFVAFGVAGFRSVRYSRRIGVLLLIPAAIMVLNLGIVIAGYSSPEGRFLVSGLWALSYLALGVASREGHGPRERAAATSGTTTR